MTLQAHLGAASPAEHAALYRAGGRAHRACCSAAAPSSRRDAYLPYRIAFDVEKLTWELDFFVRHFVEGYRGVVADAGGAGGARRRVGRRSPDELAAEPRVLCHRDYHSRNLMLHDGSLYIIDFQDARMGPDTYDLVSLLRDSYVDIADAASSTSSIAYFLALKGRHATRAEFRRRFDLMALQRNLKALGTFGYQTMTRRNPVYIQYMPRTLRYARTNLEKYPRFARLRGAAGRATIEELQIERPASAGLQ